VRTQHWQAPAEVHDAVPALHGVHDDGLHAPEPEEELDVLIAAHEPPLHVWPVEHCVHDSPPEPQLLGSVPVWQLLLVSQHPEHVVAHPPPSSVVPLDVLLVGPLSSGGGVPLLLALLVLLLYDDPLSSSVDPLELVLALPPLLVLDVLTAPEEDPLRSHLPASTGAISPAAQETATNPTKSGTSFPVRLRAALGILRSLRGARA